jgi:p-cumate 2,3-dioxygenase beta subunit
MSASDHSSRLSRSDAEDFLYAEAALLDEWRLDDWLALLTEDARYWVPPNDTPGGDPASTLFTIADDIHRIRARVTRLKDPAAHAEYPRSRTRRMIGNVRVEAAAPGPAGEAQALVHSNFVVWRFRRGERVREYVGHYRHTLRLAAGGWRIAHRVAIIDAMELASLGSVSLIL